MTPLKLSQILASRLCHDLIAPAGAIKSGLEILRETKSEDDQEDILNVIEQSSETLTKKLVFYRMAFGYSSAAQFQGAKDIERFLTDFLATTKVSFQFTDSKEEPLCEDYPNWGRLIAHLILLLVEIAPRGGHLHLEWTSSGVTLTLRGNLVALRETLKKALHGDLPVEALTPHEVQPYIASLLLSSLGASLEILTLSLEEVVLKVEASAPPAQGLFDPAPPFAPSSPT